MQNTFKRALINIGIFIVISLIILNVSLNIQRVQAGAVINGIGDVRITFNLWLLARKEYLIALVIIGTIGLILFIETVTYTAHNMNGRRKLSKYDRESYSNLLSKWKRRRGTFMVKYDKDGKPTEAGLIKAWYRFKDIFAKKQRQMADYYLLPETKKWNVVHRDAEGKEVIKAGVPVMAMKKWGLFGKFDKVWYLSGNIHSLFVGSTGRGKTFSYVLPMVNAAAFAGENIVVHDPKREIDALMRKTLEDLGYNIIVIDFVEPEKSEGWNPLDIPYKAWNKAIEDELSTWTRDVDGNYLKPQIIEEHYDPVRKRVVPTEEELIVIKPGEEYKAYKYTNLSEVVEQVLDIANTLTWEEDAKDPIWHQTAGEMFAGSAIFAMEEGNPNFVNPVTARFIIQDGDSVDDSGMPILSRYLKRYRQPLDDSTRLLQTYLESESVTKASFRASFFDKIAILTKTEDIMKMTSKSTFDMEKIFTEKTAVFLKTHDEKSTYYPLVTMFLKQLYEVGIKLSRNYPEFKLPISMNWIIDEFGLLPEIKDIEALYGAARSRGIRINGFIQTFEQLEDKYEDKIAAIIEDNSTNVIYLGSQQKSTRERFSDLAGNKLVYNNKSKDYEERPVITAERLRTFEKGRSLVNTIEWNPFIAKLPPFNRYSFYNTPHWETPIIEKPKVQYFKIKDAWYFNLRRDAEMMREELSKSGAEETQELYEDTSGYDKPGIITNANEGKLDGISVSKTIALNK